MKIISTLTFVIFLFSALAASANEKKGSEPKRNNTEAPALFPAFVASTQQFFQPITIDPATVRRSMQARSEYDELNRRIAARQSKLYEEDESIRKLQEQLRELQEKIDALLAEDAELTKLKKELESITPEIPMGSRKGFSTKTPPPSPEKEE